MFVSSFSFSRTISSAFRPFRGLSWLGSCILNRLSRSAFDTTQKLERLMAAAPSMGLRLSPAHTKQPAATGIQTAL